MPNRRRLPPSSSYRLKCQLSAALSTYVQRFAFVDWNESFAAAYQQLTETAARIPVICVENCPPSLQQLFDGPNAFDEQPSCIFVDAITWLCHELCAQCPYLLRFTCSSSIDKKPIEIERICFVRPMPFTRKVPFAIIPALFAFNAFGSSRLTGQAWQLIDILPLEFEGIEVGMAEQLNVRLVMTDAKNENAEGLLVEEEEDPIDLISPAWEPDQAIKQFFTKPRLLYNRDLFAVSLNGHKKLLYQAVFSNLANDCCQNDDLPKFVQYGQSACTELMNNEARWPCFPGRFPQKFSKNHKRRQHAGNRLFVPWRIRAMANKIALQLWPIFEPANSIECCGNVGNDVENQRTCAQNVCQFLPLPNHHLLMLQSGSFEASMLLANELSMLLDVRLCVLDCLLDIWQETTTTRIQIQSAQKNGGAAIDNPVASKIDAVLDNIESSAPCICWLREISIFFNADGGGSQFNEEFAALLTALNARMRPNARLIGENGIMDKENHSSLNSKQWPIIFLIDCSSTERMEMPERLRKLIQWEFLLEDGDEKLEENERQAFLRHTLAFGAFEYWGCDLVNTIASRTKGYTLYGMEQLLEDAKFCAISKMEVPILTEKCRPTIEIAHFERALQKRAPATGTKSSVDLTDVGGLDEAKQLLTDALHELIKQADEQHRGETIGDDGTTARFHLLRRKTGILLYGPPGCGKTLLAKAVANEFGLAFHSVKGPELLSQYVGESERNVREMFATARRTAPAVLFFDELDSLAPNRGGSNDSGSVMDRMVSQLLTELDACHWSRRKPVFVMAATNRPDLLDPCLLTPGRFDKLVPILPATDLDTKERILRPLCKHVTLEAGLELREIAKMCPGSMSGADLAGLVRGATMQRLQEMIEQIESDRIRCSDGAGDAKNGNAPPVILSLKHFELALKQFGCNSEIG